MKTSLRIVASALASLAASAALAMQAPQAPAAPAAPAPQAPAATGPVFVLLETSGGKILLELDPAKAPVSVENFLGYVRGGFYDNTVFHRVVPNFVVQGGGFSAEMVQKQTKAPIKNEWTNGLKNAKGTISMARTSDPNSATSQFFLNLKDNPALDGANGPGYAVFGRIVAGIDVLDAMGRTRTAPKEVTDLTGTKRIFPDVPAEPLRMVSAKELPSDEAARMVEAAKAAAPATPVAPVAPAAPAAPAAK